LRQFAAEEVASGLRHQLVNKISAVGALTFHLRRQLPARPARGGHQGAADDRRRAAQATQMLDLRFVRPVVPAAPLALGEVGRPSWPRSSGWPAWRWWGRRAPRRAPPIDRGELDVALFCLVENALEAVAGRGSVTVRWGQAAELAVVEMADDGPGLDEAERRRRASPSSPPSRAGWASA
jgi:hypothetical protein